MYMKMGENEDKGPLNSYKNTKDREGGKAATKQ